MKIDEFIFIEEIIYCPSQVYYYFTDNKSGEKYCIYLRWRYHDPWTSQLIRCGNDYSFSPNWEEWETIETKKQYKDDEYLELEEEVLDIVKSKFLETKFPEIARMDSPIMKELNDESYGFDIIK